MRPNGRNGVPCAARRKSMFIDDPRKWRLSKSGFSIKTGWADEKKCIAKRNKREA